jgi:hypothetical protein
VCGFVIYYLIPAAFVMGNMPMFLGILTAILLGMVLGFSLVATSIQPFLEKVSGSLNCSLWEGRLLCVHLCVCVCVCACDCMYVCVCM